MKYWTIALTALPLLSAACTPAPKPGPINRPVEIFFDTQESSEELAVCAANAWLKHKLADVEIRPLEDRSYVTIHHWPKTVEAQGDMATLIARDTQEGTSALLITQASAKHIEWLETDVRDCASGLPELVYL